MATPSNPHTATLPLVLRQVDGDLRYQDNSPGPAGGSTNIPTVFIDVAVRRTITVDGAVRASVINGANVAIRNGVSVQAGNIASEVGRIISAICTAKCS